MKEILSYATTDMNLGGIKKNKPVIQMTNIILFILYTQKSLR